PAHRRGPVYRRLATGWATPKRQGRQESTPNDLEAAVGRLKRRREGAQTMQAIRRINRRQWPEGERSAAMSGAKHRIRHAVGDWGFSGRDRCTAARSGHAWF